MPMRLKNPMCLNNERDPRSRGWRLIAGLSLFAATLLAGCATPPTDPAARASYEEANDPLEPTNRAILDVNLALDDAVIKPVAKAYRVVPSDVRKGFHNMIQTVRSPDIFANEMMQGDVDGAADTVLRMLINLTAGLGGFFDVAAERGGVQAHDTDFGVTLGKSAVCAGTYLLLPLFGPSNPRETVGLVADNFLDPVGYYTTFGEDIGRAAFEGIDKREPNIEPLEEIQRTSVDFYATLRSLYRQRRQDQITKGKPGSNIPAPAMSLDDTESESDHAAPPPTAPSENKTPQPTQ